MWEYLVKRVPMPLAQSMLDGLGQEGWELVAVVDGSGSHVAYLKRAIA